MKFKTFCFGSHNGIKNANHIFQILKKKIQNTIQYMYTIIYTLHVYVIQLHNNSHKLNTQKSHKGQINWNKYKPLGNGTTIFHRSWSILPMYERLFKL